MRRRSIIFGLAGSAAVWPIPAHAQQAVMPVIGFLGSTSPGPWTRFVEAFRGGLKETGYVDGQNAVIDFRWAEGQYQRLPALAADLVRREVAVLVATGGQPSVMAAISATSRIPIVFTLGSDPVKLGVVASLNRPGGNVTGINLFASELDGKRLGLLHAMVPKVELVAALVNPTNPNTPSRLREIEEAARSVSLRAHFLNASTLLELASAFSALKSTGAGALFVAADPFFNTQRDAIVALTASHGIPAIYEQRDFVSVGGLMSYGTDFAESYRQAGIYVGRILKGEKPADLPVVRAARFEFVINLKTAKAQKLEVPPAVSAQADEVIE